MSDSVETGVGQVRNLVEHHQPRAGTGRCVFSFLLMLDMNSSRLHLERKSFILYKMIEYVLTFRKAPPGWVEVLIRSGISSLGGWGGGLSVLSLCQWRSHFFVVMADIKPAIINFFFY